MVAAHDHNLESEPLFKWLGARGPEPAGFPTTEAAWTRLAQQAVREGLPGLLDEAITKHDLHPPPTFINFIRHHATIMAGMRLTMMNRLEPLLAALSADGIDVMLLKGAALNLTVYDRPDLRPMTDVDLLVKPEYACRAVQTLLEHGCRRGADLVREDFFPKYYYETELLTHDEQPLRIDLHARPLRPLRLAITMPSDALWQDAQSVRVGDASAQIPGPEDMFIHLAAHAAYHGFSRLLWLYDLRRLTETVGDRMKWSVVVDRAKKWKIILPVSCAVEKVESLWGPICPRDIREQLATMRVNWRDRLTLKQAPRDARSPLAHVAVSVLCTPGLRFKLGYVAAQLWPGDAHLGENYPYRHFGWTLCARARRPFRALASAAVQPVKALARIARSGLSLSAGKGSA